MQIMKGSLIVDSLLESAFNSSENAKWAKYKASVEDPRCSLISKEEYPL